jgi:hypothetical protein
MSWCLAVLASAFMHSTIHGNQKKFEIILEPKWEILDDQHTALFGGKWILAGSITFRKKAIKECVHLTKLHLKWHGPFLDKVRASLYEHNFEKKFYPIEDFFVCDGEWSKKTQTLHLNFKEKCTLQAINTFYLVLTVPAEQEPFLRQGSFCISNDCLPDQLREHMQAHELSLSLNSIHNSIHKNIHKKIALISH